MKIIKSPSPNFSNTTFKKIGVQIHKTLGLMPWTLKWLQNPKANASANYLITRKGEIHELVPVNKRAWSAGRIYKPSERARKIMKRYAWGSYVKPGHYLVQIEFECLLTQTFTQKEYSSAIQLFKSFDNKFNVPNFVNENSILEHQDTASYKPEMEKERAEILKRIIPVKPPITPKAPKENRNREKTIKEIIRLLKTLK